MDASVLVAKLGKLSSSQQSIQSLSHFCVVHREEAKTIVALWNAEYESATSDRKLACLYLANDILQNSRKQGREFEDEFVEVLPRAVRHLYRGGSDKVRKAVGRLVGIWDERKVLSSAAIKAMKEFVQHEPREVRSHGGRDEDGSRKKLKLVDPIAKAFWEVEQKMMKREDWQATKQRVVEKGIQSKDPEALEMVRKQLGMYATALKSEITARTKCVEVLKKSMQDQESGIQESRNVLQMCLIQQSNVEQTIAREKEQRHSPALPPEMDSPLHPAVARDDSLHEPEAAPPQLEQMPQTPQTPQLPPTLQLPEPAQIPHQSRVISPSLGVTPQQLPHAVPQQTQAPHRQVCHLPPPPPPMYQDFTPMSMPMWSPDPLKSGNFNGYEMSATPPMQINNGWVPQGQQNGDGMRDHRDLPSRLHPSGHCPVILSTAVETVPQDNQEFAAPDTLGHPQYGLSQPGNWGQ